MELFKKGSSDNLDISLLYSIALSICGLVLGIFL